MNKIPDLIFHAIAVLLSALFSIGISVRAPSRALDGKATITAHSGCMGLAANSIEAMEAGVKAGAQIVEFDLQYTEDGTPVLSHDKPDGGGYATLAEAFAFLAEHPGVRANVDVKSTLYLEKLPPLAEEAGVTEQLFMTGVKESDVAAVKEKCPGIPYYLNAGVGEGDDLAALADKTVALGAIGLNVYWHDASTELIRVFHKRGLPVSVWTVDDAADIMEMALIGADNITTLRPDIACSVVING